MIARIFIAFALLLTPSLAAAQLREGKRFTVLVEGKGPDVVLIPGLSSPREVWDGARKALGGRYRLHLVQVRGFGDDAGANASGPVLEPLVEEIADYIDDEIVNKGALPPAIVGHSMGGLAGMMIAARHPDLVGRLMVVDALPFIGTLFGGPAATVTSITPQAEQARAMTIVTKASTTPVTSDPGGIWSITPAGRIQVANWSRTADPRVVAQALYDDLVTDMRPEQKAITARPFVVLHANAAGPQVEAVWKRDYAGSPATLIPIDGSYHFIMLDQPAAFAARLSAFLAGE